MLAFYRSAIGKKIIMAVTGVILVGYLLTHVAANLLVFQGPEALNGYAAFLKSKPYILWPARAVLFVAAVFHILAAYQLTRRAASARPVGYRHREPQISTLASRSMRVGGVVILVFVVLHILHFTTGTLHPTRPHFEPHRVYANVVAGFQVWWVALLYVVAMAFLGLHLYHGLWGSARTLGATRPSPHPLRRPVALVIAGFIWLGFTIIPLAVLAGVVG